MKIVSWNVNGIRACIKKGFFEWLYEAKPDILCLQETKIAEAELTKELMQPKGYHTYWNSGERKGYAGVSIFTKEEPIKVERGIGVEKFDEEGRFLILEYEKFWLVNAYFPHSQRELNRLKFKLEFNDAFLRFAENLTKTTTKMVIITGDFNVAHKEIDLKNPKQNEHNAGFTIEERRWVDEFLSKGYVDTFREFEKGPGHYTWWSYRFNARKRNIGWRVDYFFVPIQFLKNIKNSYILKDVLGSDHCPIGVEVKI